MSIYLCAIGTAVPPHSIEQSDAASETVRLFCRSARGQQVLSKVFQRSGVRNRYSVVLQTSTNGEPARQSFYRQAEDDGDRGPTTADRMSAYECAAAGLALSAADEALVMADTKLGEITHVITVSCTGFHSPGVDVRLVRDLGLSPSVARTQIGFMGCHAALNALRVAKAFIDADEKACVLVCAVELCSLHYQYGERLEQIISNALFADGAAAVVARGDSISQTTAARPGWRLLDSASAIVPETEDLMSWHIRDHGFEMTLSAKVPELIETKLRFWLEPWLAAAGLSIDDVASWAIHPGGPRILTACGAACGLDASQLQASFDVLEEYGNMSSPTILFVLNRLAQQSATGPCVALAFGPGLTIEAALLERQSR